MKLAAAVQALWYRPGRLARALAPLGWPYCLLAGLRRGAYRRGLLGSWGVEVPVVVVGNITVGGAGKTPLVARLVEVLRAAGYRPGIVSRGYGGRSRTWPRAVLADSDPGEVGDEPVLLARRCDCPVMVGPDRVVDARTLLDSGRCDVLLADDGLQHYRLRRDLEIAVLDGRRRLGNGACLPAGPLREPASRLRAVDFVVVNGGPARSGEHLMELVGQHLVSVSDPGIRRSPDSFVGQRVHAVAGIGDPERFFRTLEDRGMELLRHPFPDHHRFEPGDLAFGDGLPVLMTEKDAVKCRTWATGACWYLPVEARLAPGFEDAFLARLLRSGHGAPHEPEHA